MVLPNLSFPEEVTVTNGYTKRFTSQRDLLMQKIRADNRQDLMITKSWNDFDPAYFKKQLLNFLKRRNPEFWYLAFYVPSFKGLAAFKRSQAATATHPTEPREDVFNRIADSISTDAHLQFAYWNCCNNAFHRFIVDDLGLGNILDHFPETSFELDTTLDTLLEFVNSVHKPILTPQWRTLSDMASWRPVSISVSENFRDAERQYHQMLKAFPLTVQGLNEAFFAFYILTAMYTYYIPNMDNKLETDFRNMFNDTWREEPAETRTKWDGLWMKIPSHGSEPTLALVPYTMNSFKTANVSSPTANRGFPHRDTKEFTYNANRPNTSPAVIATAQSQHQGRSTPVQPADHQSRPLRPLCDFCQLRHAPDRCFYEADGSPSKHWRRPKVLPPPTGSNARVAYDSNFSLHRVNVASQFTVL